MPRLHQWCCMYWCVCMCVHMWLCVTVCVWLYVSHMRTLPLPANTPRFCRHVHALRWQEHQQLSSFHTKRSRAWAHWCNRKHVPHQFWRKDRWQITIFLKWEQCIFQAMLVKGSLAHKYRDSSWQKGVDFPSKMPLNGNCLMEKDIWDAELI